MYIPKEYKTNDLQYAMELIRGYAFGLLISSGDDYPFVTHLPFLSVEENGKLRLFTHLAKVNPHANVLANNEVLAVFTGPHAYISATWYHNKRNVPTWNYGAVHVKGKARLIEDDETIASLLQQTVAFFDGGPTDHHKALPAEYKQALAKEITFVEIEVQSIEIKAKFNQNKPKEDLLNVIEHLETSGNQVSEKVADMMKRFNAEKLK
ncbi:MAG TPA: FMN-binding negative transcriptional regulator [Bacteroidia bacterium]